jgi:hypothetical protein
MLLLLMSLMAWPVQDNARIPVFVEHAGTDYVGGRLRYQISQSLARSATLSQSPNRDRAVLIVNLSTLGSPAGEEYQTIYSVAYLLRDGEGLDNFLTAHVAYCGADRLADCAESIVSDVDQQRALLVQVLADMQDDAPFADDAAY